MKVPFKVMCVEHGACVTEKSPFPLHVGSEYLVTAVLDAFNTTYYVLDGYLGCFECTMFATLPTEDAATMDAQEKEGILGAEVQQY